MWRNGWIFKRKVRKWLSLFLNGIIIPTRWREMQWEGFPRSPFSTNGKAGVLFPWKCASVRTAKAPTEKKVILFFKCVITCGILQWKFVYIWFRHSLNGNSPATCLCLFNVKIWFLSELIALIYIQWSEVSDAFFMLYRTLLLCIKNVLLLSN
jgi:hypothetical protein